MNYKILQATKLYNLQPYNKLWNLIYKNLLHTTKTLQPS